MSEIAETYLVISLLMAVFAAVAAVGTAIVLGVGFERLRSGFEVVRKQTAFFSDAIRSLDERTDKLDDKTGVLEKQAVILDQKTVSLELHQNELADMMREGLEGRSAYSREATLQKAGSMGAEVAALASRMAAQRDRIAARTPFQDNRPLSFSVSYPMRGQMPYSEDDARRMSLQ